MCPLATGAPKKPGLDRVNGETFERTDTKMLEDSTVYSNGTSITVSASKLSRLNRSKIFG